MPHLDIIWTDENIAHLAEHDVSPEEAEVVLQEPTAATTSRSSGRPIAFGFTSAGRKLAVVYEIIDHATVYPITAYDIE